MGIGKNFRKEGKETAENAARNAEVAEWKENARKVETEKPRKTRQRTRRAQ